MVKVELCKKEPTLQIAEGEYWDLKVSSLKCYYSVHTYLTFLLEVTHLTVAR